MSLEMRLGKDIAGQLEKDGMVVFRDLKEHRAYAIFEIEDKKSAIIGIGDGGTYIVNCRKVMSTVDYKEAKDTDKEEKCKQKN